VQGDRTMGIWEKAPDKFLDRLGNAFDFDPPREHGYAAVDAVKALANGKTKVFFALGGNFLMAVPDTELVSKGMKKCDLTVHIATKLNRSHLVHGKTALILPCLGRTEIDKASRGPQFVTTEDTAGRVRMSMGDLEPISEHLKSETSIICELAAETLREKSMVDWVSFSKDYDKIRNKIEEVVNGFDDFNEKVRAAGGFYLPNGARTGDFNTKNGKALFTVNALPKNSVANNHFILMTIRSHDQFNTTVYDLNDRYRGIYNGREIILMHKADMKTLGLNEKDEVNITSHFNNEKRSIKNFKVIPYEIAEGCVAVYFPEGNALISIDNNSPESKCPASKFVEVSIEKAL
jgi:molybdopterin-dependent oxidoreductase alpha subunit